jgi:hypothetical protein
MFPVAIRKVNQVEHWEHQYNQALTKDSKPSKTR